MQHWTDGEDDVKDTIKHMPLRESYMPTNKKGEELERRNMEIYTDLMKSK